MAVIFGHIEIFKFLQKKSNWYFSLFIPLKKCEKKTKNSRKNVKIREPVGVEIFAIFREDYFFHTLLKVYIEKCTFLLC